MNFSQKERQFMKEMAEGLSQLEEEIERNGLIERGRSHATKIFRKPVTVAARPKPVERPREIQNNRKNKEDGIRYLRNTSHMAD